MIYLIYEPIKMSCTKNKNPPVSNIGSSSKELCRLNMLKFYYTLVLYLGGLLKMERCFVLPFYNNFTG